MQQNPDITAQEYGNLIEKNARTMYDLQGQLGQIGRQLSGVSQTPNQGSLLQGVEPLQGSHSPQASYPAEVPVDEAEPVGVRRFPTQVGQQTPVGLTNWTPSMGTLPVQQSPYHVPNGSPAHGIPQQTGFPSQGTPQQTRLPVQGWQQQGIQGQQMPQQQIPMGQGHSAQQGPSAAPPTARWPTAQALQQIPSSFGAQASAIQGTGPAAQQQAGPGQSFGPEASSFQGAQPGSVGQFGQAGSLAQSGGHAMQQHQGFHTRQPTVNLLDEEDHFVLEADMPGVKKEDLDVTIYGNTVTIEAQVETSKETGAVLVGERAPSFLYRTIQLPAEVDADEVDAKLADGVLTVEIPKLEPGKGLHRIKL